MHPVQRIFNRRTTRWFYPQLGCRQQVALRVWFDPGDILGSNQHIEVCENLAIIHATSKVGVNRSQMAITTLKEPVIFGENTYPVRVLAALAAVDSESHLAAMQALATIFMDTGLTKQLLDATSGKQIYQLLADQES